MKPSVRNRRLIFGLPSEARRNPSTHEHTSSRDMLEAPSPSRGNVLPCGQFFSMMGHNICECTTDLGDRFLQYVRGGCSSAMDGWCMSLGLTGGCSQVLDTLLLCASAFCFAFWLLLPRSMWEGWLCGYGMLFASFLGFSLWRNSRELQLRTTLEASAKSLAEENSTLRASTDQLRSDLLMLQDTVGALGDKGDDWLGQLRFLYNAQKRENDRQSLMLRGHARIVLLQLIQHFDSDRNLRLDVSELAAAEAFLSVGFPDINIQQLEAKAASGGVTIADLEPLLLTHLQGDSVEQERVRPWTRRFPPLQS